MSCKLSINLRKQLYSAVLTLLYVAVMVKPLIPTVIYYVNYDYIVTELCENKDKPEMQCHGKCYLKKLQNKISPSPIKDKPISKVLLIFKDYPITIVNIDSYKSVIPAFFKKLKNPNYSKHFIISDFSIPIFHPPKNLF